MIDMLEDAAFDGKEIDEHEARELIDQAQDLFNGDDDRDDNHDRDHH
jgi:hypothetical protein